MNNIILVDKLIYDNTKNQLGEWYKTQHKGSLIILAILGIIILSLLIGLTQANLSPLQTVALFGFLVLLIFVFIIVLIVLICKLL